MTTKIIVLFIILNIINVILQTFKSLATIKCGKTVAALVNAIAYGLYTVVLVYTAYDFSLWVKILTVGGANLIGVYVVKWIEEKSRKDKLWKVEVTIPVKQVEQLFSDIDFYGIKSYNYLNINNNYTVFNFYCESQAQSAKVKKLLKNYDAKYFVTESKIL